jgi:cytochrome oxidase assembly protein ShyY1
VTRSRIPLIPTILVLAAAGVMVWLGIWQLHRMAWKEGLLAEYRAAAGKPPVAFPRIPTDQSLLFRRSEAFCLQPVGWRASAGRNRAAQPGWRHVADCRTGAEGPGFAVDMGWSQRSDAPVWKGGKVEGIIGPDHDAQVMLVSDTPAPGLIASAPPSLNDVPNNHFAYAIQWFIFAGLAVGIYAVALARRKRTTR